MGPNSFCSVQVCAQAPGRTGQVDISPSGIPSHPGSSEGRERLCLQLGVSQGHQEAP